MGSLSSSLIAFWFPLPVAMYVLLQNVARRFVGVIVDIDFVPPDFVAGTRTVSVVSYCAVNGSLLE